MEQDLIKIDKKFEQTLIEKQRVIETAQNELAVIQGQKEMEKQRMREYYDAIAQKAAIDAILAQGKPII